MDMIKGMVNRYDYDEYVSLCEKKGVKSNDKYSFYKGIGYLYGALSKYPDLGWQKAYTKILMDMAEQPAKDKECGGGDKTEKKDKPIEVKIEIEAEKIKIPPLSKRIVNYGKAQVEHTLAGRKLITKNEFLRRLSICSSNECGYFRDDWTCLKCGCPMKTKAEWAEQVCRLNKW